LNNELIVIQFLDSTGTWRTLNSGVVNNSQLIANALKAGKARYPTLRFRAIGSSTGQLYDMVM